MERINLYIKFSDLTEEQAINLYKVIRGDDISNITKYINGYFANLEIYPKYNVIDCYILEISRFKETLTSYTEVDYDTSITLCKYNTIGLTDLVVAKAKQNFL